MTPFEREISVSQHEELVGLEVGQSFELFGKKFILVEKTSDVGDVYEYTDYVAQEMGSYRYFSFYHTLYAGETKYEPQIQEFLFTEVEKKTTHIWVVKK